MGLRWLKPQQFARICVIPADALPHFNLYIRLWSPKRLFIGVFCCKILYILVEGEYLVVIAILHELPHTLRVLTCQHRELLLHICRILKKQLPRPNTVYIMYKISCTTIFTKPFFLSCIPFYIIPFSTSSIALQPFDSITKLLNNNSISL